MNTFCPSFTKDMSEGLNFASINKLSSGITSNITSPAFIEAFFVVIKILFTIPFTEDIISVFSKLVFLSKNS